MDISRREFATTLTGAVGAAALVRDHPDAVPLDPCHLPAPLRALTPKTDGVRPITDDERRGRMARAQHLMTEQGIGAIVLEPGSSMHYFTGTDWGLSERTFAVVLPAAGEPSWVCPAFEEARAKERIRFGHDVRVWQEDESPFALIAGVARDRGVAGSALGLEEQVRFFVGDGIRRAAPTAELVSATPVTAGCRMFKSAAELALMQHATDITMLAFKAAFATLRSGMTQYELGDTMTTALTRLGGSDPWALVGLGVYSAYPHGTVQPQRLARGDIVLLDAGCAVEGYQSDVTRTTVFGRPTRRQTEVWNLERKAQDAAFAAAQVGATCDSVDSAARQVLADAGFGPDYRVPGLPHRTGHGIGLDGHEWTNFVRGNSTRLAPGMCFSDEPTIAIYGEFGIRLEDCLYITDQGPRFFSPQSPAIDHPLA
jgi:Xaa-Pro dipeptidase